ncbi:MAG: hypothetical protein SOW90_05080 [Gallibacter sp.]|nr:hypothetical protein [Gallibacter sp.]
MSYIHLWVDEKARIGIPMEDRIWRSKQYHPTSCCTDGAKIIKNKRTPPSWAVVFL